MRPEEYKDIAPEKFALVNENKKLHDKELVTKPIGFFRDAMNRFARNKGSIVGAIVIGILVLFALVVPVFSQYTVSYQDTYYRYTLPKLFNSDTTDFLDGGTKKSLNEYSFIYYYAMGAETGHNAVKRQEYTKGSDGMYNFRLDTYQQTGVVFKTVTQAEYDSIQQYQDDNNVQVIYPTTEVSLRPSANQDKTNANYWYKTKLNGSVTVPDGYSFNADGSINIENIYAAYSIPVMDSSNNSDTAAHISVVTKGSGYAISMNALVVATDEEGAAILDEEGNETYVYQNIGFISVEYKEGNNYTTVVDSLNDASVFTFDTTYHTFLVNLTGHANPSDDGNYYFGLASKSGSTVNVVSANTLGDGTYIPFSLHEGENLVTNPVVDKIYTFSANRAKTTTYDFYGGNAVGGNFSVEKAVTASCLYKIEEALGGYYLLVPNAKNIYNYVKISVNGDKNSITTVSDSTNATVFSFDSANKALHLNLTGHTTAALDGDYYFAINKNSSGVGSFVLSFASDIDGVNRFYLEIIQKNLVDSLPVPVTELAAGEYRMGLHLVVNVPDIYSVDGNFKGDNYHSKMRVEGEGNYVYSYAIQKTGHTYEIRINYYEYYRYYHKVVLHDRVNEPYFLFGTTANGQDIFTCLASGARFSFIMAITVAIVNMTVGAIYGAIEGYYGGKIDLVMERIVEILSAVPFMIVITLLKYHMRGASQVLILFIAFFLTGWIGESGLVRMQFYRFKNQEYVLAARTLGASDPRIMFKHIFPNSLGTIITSSVLVIPGMIFSETSLSYLGIINLNSGDMTSVGTLLANAQPYLVSYPHMILFPAIFISLLMLCFNLFGNGLRDAFNTSLRGVEE